ncbi:MAG: hypothetical protein HY727_15175 [Candidatus Rokubacteria bacterium]|nr:hypothetical protein [Candidatus Rokubacteria bacterium]
MQILTIEELLRATEWDVVLPETSALVGRDVRVKIRRMARAEYFSLLPPLPAEAVEWPVAEFAERELAWLATLMPEALAARRAALRESLYEIVALGVVDPPMTPADAKRLGDDAVLLKTEILMRSGILTPEATKETGPDPAPSSEEAGARAA